MPRPEKGSKEAKEWAAKMKKAREAKKCCMKGGEMPVEKKSSKALNAIKAEVKKDMKEMTKASKKISTGSGSGPSKIAVEPPAPPQVIHENPLVAVHHAAPKYIPKAKKTAKVLPQTEANKRVARIGRGLAMKGGALEDIAGELPPELFYEVLQSVGVTYDPSFNQHFINRSIGVLQDVTRLRDALASSRNPVSRARAQILTEAINNFYASPPQSQVGIPIRTPSPPAPPAHGALVTQNQLQNFLNNLNLDFLEEDADAGDQFLGPPSLLANRTLTPVSMFTGQPTGINWNVPMGPMGALSSSSGMPYPAPQLPSPPAGDLWIPQLQTPQSIPTPPMNPMVSPISTPSSSRTPTPRSISSSPELDMFRDLISGRTTPSSRGTGMRIRKLTPDLKRAIMKLLIK